ncbi:recombinase family protein [Brevundimonas sp. NIBR11]|uniref:recombinase family protein n=1 Tax=Brevundimonas sp. NIBR11 TaxID=3015999 RepID=UPI0022F0DDDA|nr:recombinase family protein [Brevundimonas sp. NIBR11]
MALVGYARVSSTGQSLEVQLEKLTEAGCEEIFAEKRSGTTRAERVELEAALRFVRKGDVLLVSKLDRLARSVNDLSSIVADLDRRGVGFKVMDQAIDTTTSNGRLMLNMLAAFAEFETDLRAERQRDGIEKAKAEGRYTGRPATIKRDAVRSLRAEGLGPSEIAKRLGIGRASVYRLLEIVD